MKIIDCPLKELCATYAYRGENNCLKCKAGESWKNLQKAIIIYRKYLNKLAKEMMKIETIDEHKNEGS